MDKPSGIRFTEKENILQNKIKIEVLGRHDGPNSIAAKLRESIHTARLLRGWVASTSSEEREKQ